MQYERHLQQPRAAPSRDREATGQVPQLLRSRREGLGFPERSGGRGQPRIARPGFRNDKRRSDKIEPVGRITPPLTRYLLIRRDNDITGRPRGEVADDRRFDVCGGLRRVHHVSG